MNKNINQHNNSTFEEAEDSIDIQKWIIKILSNWYYFVLCAAIAIVACYYFNRTISPLYKSSSTVLIEEQQQQAMMGAQSVMQDFGVGAYRNVNNQIVLLSSYSMIERTINKLPLNIEYYYEAQLRKYSYYKNAPIKAHFTNAELIPPGVEFSALRINDKKYKLTVVGTDELESFEKEVNYGDNIKIGDFSLKVSQVSDFKMTDPDEETPEIFFKYRDDWSLITEFNERIAIDFVMDEATIIEVSLVGSNALRDVDFLKTLVQEFLNENLERKNREAIRTVEFITTQLNEVAESLAVSENSLEDYRTQNNVINMSSQTELLIEKANKLETQKSTLLIKKDYYNYLSESFSKDVKENSIISPSTIGIDDPVVSAYIKQYVEVQFDKQMLAPKAPYHEVAEAKLKKIKGSIIEATKNAIENTNISIEDVEIQLSEIQKQAIKLPSKERKLLGIQRQLTVNDTYYTFLLQKRSEAQIQRASNAPDNMLIDPARILERTNQKKTKLNYIIALILGGGIPLGIIIILELLNNKIKTKEDIEDRTNYPILGSISRSKYDTTIPTLSHPRSTFTESFRSLRTRLDFMQGGKKGYTIMVTSSLSGEGKTFVAINLAGVYSLADKKTVLVGYDMRKPKIAEYLEQENRKGLSNYLSGAVELDDIICNHEKNLDIIYSGTIPPNPGELAANKERNLELFKTLRERYDYIIVDSTPISMVGDAFLIGRYVDRVLFIAKHNYTEKRIFEDCMTHVAQNELQNVGIVANDITIDRSEARYGKQYGYSYGYAHGGGYYAQGQNGYTED